MNILANYTEKHIDIRIKKWVTKSKVKPNVFQSFAKVLCTFYFIR